MKVKDFFTFASFGMKTILFRKKDPILGTIILTDYCNLTCKHCAVNNINKIIYPYKEIRAEMEAMYMDGIRILFFCGGETLLWKDEDRDIRDLVKEAKEIGFCIVNIVTNGTINLDIPEADVVFLSLDGLEKNHNYIRGTTFKDILHNVDKASKGNICVYMAVNNKNYGDIEGLCKIVKENKNLRCISFNLHTPYEGTEGLTLSKDQKEEVIKEIGRMIDEKYPVFNLKSALKYHINNNWKRPCHQCIVSEGGKRYVCGRCIDIDGLCDQCGYLFVNEFTLLCSGNPIVILDMMRTYLKYV